MALSIPKQIELMVDIERDAWVEDHGDRAELMRGELAILAQIKKACEAKIRATRDIAIEEGFARNEMVWTKEHIVQGHYKNRFTWNK